MTKKQIIAKAPRLKTALGDWRGLPQRRPRRPWRFRPDRVIAWVSGTRYWWEYRADLLIEHGVGRSERRQGAGQDQMLELRVFD